MEMAVEKKNVEKMCKINMKGCELFVRLVVGNMWVSFRKTCLPASDPGWSLADVRCIFMQIRMSETCRINSPMKVILYAFLSCLL